MCQGLSPNQQQPYLNRANEIARNDYPEEELEALKSELLTLYKDKPRAPPKPTAGPSHQPTAGPSRQPTAGPGRQPAEAGPSRQPAARQDPASSRDRSQFPHASSSSRGLRQSSSGSSRGFSQSGSRWRDGRSSVPPPDRPVVVASPGTLSPGPRGSNIGQSFMRDGEPFLPPMPGWVQPGLESYPTQLGGNPGPSQGYAQPGLSRGYVQQSYPPPGH